MDVVALHQILALFMWFPLVIILAIYLLIARFYQRFSGKRTHFWLYTVPILLYGGSFVRYASIEQFVGDAFGDLLAALAGVVLMVLTTTLYLQMMKNRANTT